MSVVRICGSGSVPKCLGSVSNCLKLCILSLYLSYAHLLQMSRWGTGYLSVPDAPLPILQFHKVTRYPVILLSQLSHSPLSISYPLNPSARYPAPDFLHPHPVTLHLISFNQSLIVEIGCRPVPPGSPPPGGGGGGGVAWVAILSHPSQ